MKREERRLSLPEAAEALGVSEITARRWIKSGKLRASQPGRNYQVPESAVEELLEQAPKAPAPHKEVSDPRASDMRRGDYLFSQVAIAGELNRRWKKELAEKREARNSRHFTIGDAREFAGWAKGVVGVCKELSEVCRKFVFKGYPAADEERDLKDALLGQLGRMGEVVGEIVEEWGACIDQVQEDPAERERQREEAEHYKQEFQKIVAENFSETVNA